MVERKLDLDVRYLKKIGIGLYLTPFFKETETEEVELHPISKRAIGEPQLEFAEGGIVPRVAYRDGSNWLDKLSDDDRANMGRGWYDKDYKMDPAVLERIKLREIQKQSEAHEEGFLSPLDYEPGGKMAHKKDWGIIPA